MAITYKRAPTVETGEKPKSSDWNGLALSVNDHLSKGVGDGTWRLWYKAVSLFRNIRGTPDGVTFPSVDEFFTTFIHAKPGETSPVLDPLNDNNPVASFALGSENGSYPQDDEQRLNAIPASALPSTPREIWELGKRQRGAIDLTLGNEASPTLQAARSFANTVLANQMQPTSTGYTAFLRKYGGVFPFVKSNALCGTGILFDDENGTYYFSGGAPDYALTFRRIDGGSPVVFASGCEFTGIDQDTGQGIVNGANWKAVRILDDEYQILQRSGEIVHLPLAEYIYDPGTENAALLHTDALSIAEFMQMFGSGFRGTESERADDAAYRVRNVAFDFDKFFTTQYLLAPAMGETSGNTVTPIYPYAEASDTSYGPGEVEQDLPWNGSGTPYTPANGGSFVCAGCLITATNLTEAVTVEISNPDSSLIVGTVSVPAGNTERVQWFDTEVACDTLRARVVSGVITDGTFTPFKIEFALLERMKPRAQDAYVVLRRGTAKGDVGTLDAIGHTTSAKELSDNYFEHGSIINANGIPTQLALEDNPFYETARRTFRERLRLYGRDSFVGYEVNDAGKSLLYFNRIVNGVDAWDGLAPAIDPVTTIEANRVYRVEGTITYGGVSKSDTTFTGLDGIESFEGDGMVYEHDGIYALAPRGGLSNEWLMFLSSTCYNSSEDSLFKPEGNGDVIGVLANKAHFLSNNLKYYALCNHAAYGLCDPPLYVSSPSAHNYWSRLNANDRAPDEIKQKFYKANPIYPMDYDAESVTYDRNTGQVCVKFSGRLRSHPNAPDVIPKGNAPSACDDEDYRTDENTLRQYLRMIVGAGQCNPKWGDAAELQNPLDSGAWGSCLPRFYFTRKVPSVHVDSPTDNDTEENTDTRMLAGEMQWVAWLIDAICEGYADLATTAHYPSCADRPMNYRIENLCLQAFGAQSFGLFPSTVREDKPFGIGPYSNTTIYADSFNRLSSAVNLLVHAPLELPFTFESRRREFEGTRIISASQSGVDPGSDPAGGGCAANQYLTSGYVSGSTGVVTMDEFSEVSTALDLTWGNQSTNASASAAIDYNPLFGPTHGFVLECAGGVLSYRIKFKMEYAEIRMKAPQPYLQALDASLADNLNTSFALIGTAVINEDVWANTYPVGNEPIIDDPWNYHWGNGEANVTNIGLTNNRSGSSRCVTAGISPGAGVFSLSGLLNEPGYVVPSSFYYAMLERAIAASGNATVSQRNEAVRYVSFNIGDNVIGILTIPFSDSQ